MPDFKKNEAARINIHQVDGILVSHKQFPVGEGSDKYFHRTHVTISSPRGNVMLALFSDGKIPILHVEEEE